MMNMIKITDDDKYLQLYINEISLLYNKKTEELSITKKYGEISKEVDHFNKEGYLKKTELHTSRGTKVIDYYKNENIIKREHYDKNDIFEKTEYADQRKISNIPLINYVNIVKTTPNVTFTLFKKDEYDKDYIFKNYSIDLEKLRCSIIEKNKEKIFDKYGNIKEEIKTDIMTDKKNRVCYFKDNLSVEIDEDLRGISNIKILTRNYKAEKITEEQLKNILINDERITEGQWKNWKIREERSKEGLKKERVIELQTDRGMSR